LGVVNAFPEGRFVTFAKRIPKESCSAFLTEYSPVNSILFAVTASLSEKLRNLAVGRLFVPILENAKRRDRFARLKLR
jgi:hypothetical protein